MTDDIDNQRQLAIKVAESTSELERMALLAWAEDLLRIRDSNLPALRKAAAAVKLTTKSKVIWPATKAVAREVKKFAWDKRDTKSRLGLAGAAIGVTVFGGQGAGIAALGTAIGVPLWVVLGAGGAFAGMLIEEITQKLDETNQSRNTTNHVTEKEHDERNT